MAFYEVLFETGAMSIMNCESEEEAMSFVAEQDRRARSGEPGGPIGQPAERIAKVYKYEKHPDAYNEDMTATADVLKKEVAALVDGLKDENGVVNIAVLADEVRGIAHPMVTGPTEPFASMFKMEAEGELDLSSLEGNA